jgi:hypothetical protein
MRRTSLSGFNSSDRGSFKVLTMMNAIVTLLLTSVCCSSIVHCGGSSDSESEKSPISLNRRSLSNVRGRSVSSCFQEIPM